MTRLENNIDSRLLIINYNTFKNINENGIFFTF